MFVKFRKNFAILKLPSSFNCFDDFDTGCVLVFSETRSYKTVHLSHGLLTNRWLTWPEPKKKVTDPSRPNGYEGAFTQALDLMEFYNFIQKISKK